MGYPPRGPPKRATRKKKTNTTLVEVKSRWLDFSIKFIWLVVSIHLKNMSKNGIISPSRGENERYLKPPPSHGLWKIIPTSSLGRSLYLPTWISLISMGFHGGTWYKYLSSHGPSVMGIKHFGSWHVVVRVPSTDRVRIPYRSWGSPGRNRKPDRLPVPPFFRGELLSFPGVYILRSDHFFGGFHESESFTG